MATGKAVCDCNQPDTCLCMAEVEANGETYVYYQGHSLPKICVHDKDAKGVNVIVHLISKSCISELPDCPSGVIYQAGKNEVLYKISHSQVSPYELRYINPNSVNIISNYNIVRVLESLMNGLLLDQIDFTRYILEIDECKGEVKKISSLTFDNQNLSQGQILTSSYIDVYPKYELKLGVVIRIWEETEIYKSSDSLKIRPNPIFNPKQHNNSNEEWFELSDTEYCNKNNKSPIITGFYKHNIGGGVINLECEEVKEKFNKDINSFSFFHEIKDVLTGIAQSFSPSPYNLSSKQPIRSSYPILSAKFLPPVITVSGGIELDVFKEQNKLPVLKGKVDLSLQPLIGIELKLDLIQAFATYYKLQHKVAFYRDWLAGNDSNDDYLIGNLDIVIKGIINVEASFLHNNGLDFELRDNTEGKLSVSGTAKFEVGIKKFFVEAYFSAGGTIKAECCLGTQIRKPDVSNIKEGLDLVLYHNGLELRFYAVAGFGSVSRVKIKTNTEVEHVWQIAKELKKDASKCRWKII